MKTFTSGMNPDNHFNKIPHTEGAYKTAPNVSIFDMQCVAHNLRMEEIDKRLDLLKEYIKYRTEWLVKYEGYHNANFYYADKCGIVFISPLRSDEDYYHTKYEMGMNIILSSSPNILSFEEFVEKLNNVLLRPNPLLNFLKNIHTRNEGYETFLHKIEKLGFRRKL